MPPIAQRAPGAKAPEGQLGRVAGFFSDSRDPFQKMQAQYLQLLTARETGTSIQFEDALDRTEAQIAQLTELAANPPRYLFFLPVDPEAARPAIEALRDAGTRVIGLDHRLADMKPPLCDTVIYEDPVGLGERVGETVTRALKRKAAQEGTGRVAGRVAQLRGRDDEPWCTAVNEGFTQALRKEPGIRLVHDAPTEWTAVLATQRTQELARLQPDVDVLFAHSDETALAASNALRQLNLRDRALILGVDGFGGPEGGVEMIRKNDIDGTAFRPMLVDFAWALARHWDSSPGFQPKPAYELQGRMILPADLDNLRSNQWMEWPELGP